MSKDFEEQWQQLAQTMKAQLQASFKQIEANFDERLKQARHQLEQEFGTSANAEQSGSYQAPSAPVFQPLPASDGASTSQTDLANRLHSAAIHLLRRVRQSDVLTGISPARLSALSVVGFGGPCTISDLANAEQVSLPSISRIVAALEQEGLVRREGDERDGRLVRIAATEKGLRILQEGRARRTGQLNDLLKQMTTAELEATAQAVAALERLLSGPH